MDVKVSDGDVQARLDQIKKQFYASQSGGKPATKDQIEKRYQQALNEARSEAAKIRDTARAEGQKILDDFRSRIKSANRLPRFATLTTREREVLKMLAEGNSVKEIACDLNLSVKTVEAHKFNLMRKLDIHNKAQLVQYAIQKKIIKIPNLV